MLALEAAEENLCAQKRPRGVGAQGTFGGRHQRGPFPPLDAGLLAMTPPLPPPLVASRSRSPVRAARALDAAATAADSTPPAKQRHLRFGRLGSPATTISGPNFERLLGMEGLSALRIGDADD